MYSEVDAERFVFLCFLRIIKDKITKSRCRFKDCFLNESTLGYYEHYNQLLWPCKFNPASKIILTIAAMRYFCCVFNYYFMIWCYTRFAVTFSLFNKVRVTEWPPIGN